MLEIILAILMSLVASAPEGTVESCELSSKALCCVWQYEEVGCYHYFDVREEWCVTLNDLDLTWEFRESLEDYEEDYLGDSVDRLR